MFPRSYLLLSALAMVFASTLSGQHLCTGNLGENILKEGDFGTGDSNIVLNDPGIAPGYVHHDSASAPPNGSYMLTNDMSAWNFLHPSWLPLNYR